MKSFSAGKILITSAGLLANSAIHADGSISLFYVPKAEIEVNSNLGTGSDDGSGFALSGALELTPSFELAGDYQSATIDDGSDDFDAKYTRFHARLKGESGSGVDLRWLDMSLDTFDVDGFGLGARLMGSLSDGLTAFAGGAFYDLSGDSGLDFDGLEFHLGASLLVSERTSLNAEYRTLSMDHDDSDLELDLSDIRLGVQFRF